MQMQSKMMVYDQSISELNNTRLRGTSFPIVHSLIQASRRVNIDVSELPIGYTPCSQILLWQPRSQQMTSNFEVLAKITSEPPALPPVEHAGAHILNAPIFERKYSKAYLGNPKSRDAAALRRQIAKGAREALEDQYWDVMERTVQARPMEARLGGDPSIANKVRAFLFVRYYKSGEWEDRIEVCLVLFCFVL
jgi:nuclear pore complex protein Nup93